MKLEQIKLGELTLFGYTGDYVFESIRDKHTFYESTALEAWTPLFADAKTVLDIGANLGNHTVYWATQLALDRLYAFEPLEQNYLALTRNVEANGLRDRVTTVQAAVGSGKGSVTVAHYDITNLGGTSFRRSDDSSGIELVSIDEYLQSHGNPHVDFVKIDTEGFETEVLLGMSATIGAMRPVLWIEVGENSWRSVEEILRPFDYRLYDTQAANLLFMPQERVSAEVPAGHVRIMEERLHYLERTNLYYGNYLKVKKQIAYQTDKAKELQSSLAAKKDEISSLQKQITDTDARAADFIAQVRDQQERLERQASDLSANARIISEKEAVIRGHVERISAQAAQIGEQHEQMIALESTLSAQNERMAAQAEVLVGKNDQLNAANLRLSELDKQLMKLEQEKSGLYSQTQALLGALRREQTQTEQLTNQLSAEQRQIARQFEKLTELTSLNKELTERLHASDAQNQAIRERLLKDAAEWDRETEVLRYAQSQLKRLNVQITQLRSQNAIYDEKLQKVYGTWYGRFTLRVYKALKKLKNGLLRHKS